ncbi:MULTISPECIES: glycosyltransferase [unclassified Vibrio]|uniref:glycosyltransferase n=1 Tax=unclassified Vibrio TaxID=2614977 RepID=UPI0027CC09A6|nr:MULTISPECIES: glycosyltransferase [unclassified Vibrio]MDQ2109557.1 glycosyltransferase [Vibrio sp. 2017_1457_15]MDQ2162442.1 glycosyltransferase [Vibrio sp. 2017_1457_13]
MKKILYIVSTLKRSGPTNQLFNLIKNLDRSVFEPSVATLSPEPEDSRWNDYEKLGINLYSLNLSRLGGILFAKPKLRNIIDEIKPDIIHTQGIRADSLLSSFSLNIPWLMTSRNYPVDDYPTKFGKLKGSIMVKQHLLAMERCENLVACSKTIQKKLNDHGLKCFAIQNGVSSLEVNKLDVDLYSNLSRPIFVSVGSLIPRKNMELLISVFSKLPNDTRGSLVILGDGPLMDSLKAKNVNGVHLLGNVNNVPDYLAGADYFLSSSLSEGLPNTVLEALSAGLPVILSNIESHLEIACESSSACKTFTLNYGEASLAKLMGQVNELFDEHSVIEAKRIANEVFSAKSMSQKYQDFYKTLLEGK